MALVKVRTGLSEISSFALKLPSYPAANISAPAKINVLLLIVEECFTHIPKTTIGLIPLYPEVQSYGIR